MSEPVTVPGLLRFGVFEVDLKTGELRKQGLKLKLQIQPFRILATLLERPGELVTREEIREKLWPADTFIDFEHSVNSSIKKLREVLSDDAETPRYIETLPRRGYRFIAAVETGQPWGDQFIASVETARGAVSTSAPVSPPGNVAAGMSPVQQVGAVREPPLRKGWIIALMTGAVVASLAAILALNLAGVRDRVMRAVRAVREPSLPKIESIAVLPLANLSGDKKQEYFADGMTDELITTVAKIRSLRVISRTSSGQYKDTKKSILQIARELNVDAVVEGSVLRSGNRVRITATVIHGSTERRLWGGTYEGDFGDVLILQGEVASAIAEEIRIGLTPQEHARLIAGRPVNPEAYELYLMGRYFMGRWPADLEKATQYFEQAVAKDPQYAPAYAGLSLAYSGASFFRPPRELNFKAKAAALKALELDDTLAEAHTAMGRVLTLYDWDWAAAERELKRGIELNPSSPVAHRHYWSLLVALGRFGEAIAEAERARNLDPLSVGSYRGLAWVHSWARHYDQAIAYYQQALALDPSHTQSRVGLAATYFLKGMYAEALKEDERLGAPGDGPHMVVFYALTGRRSQALAILQPLERRWAQEKYVDSTGVAQVYGSLGDTEHACAWLNRAYEERDPEMPWVFADAAFDRVHEAACFQGLRRRMHFPS
ncbi:MAG: winged helix-turn-helix domain-containing protein [Acidobacteriia bacterium]|nr:winged helix-turn-helix domain-containing protein [Terriglobia bacterium]